MSRALSLLLCGFSGVFAGIYSYTGEFTDFSGVGFGMAIDPDFFLQCPSAFVYELELDKLDCDYCEREIRNFVAGEGVNQATWTSGILAGEKNSAYGASGIGAGYLNQCGYEDGPRGSSFFIGGGTRNLATDELIPTEPPFIDFYNLTDGLLPLANHTECCKELNPTCIGCIFNKTSDEVCNDPRFNNDGYRLPGCPQYGYTECDALAPDMICPTMVDWYTASGPAGSTTASGCTVTAYNSAPPGTGVSLSGAIKNLGDLGLNNQISYISVPTGCQIVLYEDGDFLGSFQDFDATADLTGGSWNDKASSAIVQRPSVKAPASVVRSQSQVYYHGIEGTILKTVTILPDHGGREAEDDAKCATQCNFLPNCDFWVRNLTSKVCWLKQINKPLTDNSIYNNNWYLRGAMRSSHQASTSAECQEWCTYDHVGDGCCSWVLGTTCQWFPACVVSADFSQSNLPGIQVTGMEGIRYGDNLIFPWINDGYRKMVLTTLDGSTVKAGYVSSSADFWQDPSTWTSSNTYTLSNVQSNGCAESPQPNTGDDISEMSSKCDDTPSPTTLSPTTSPTTSPTLSPTSADSLERYSMIGAGTMNKILSSGDDIFRANFIGAGRENNITGKASLSAIGAGWGNEMYQSSSAIVAGKDNKVSCGGCFIGGGSSNHLNCGEPGDTEICDLSNLSGGFLFNAIGAGTSNAIKGSDSLYNAIGAGQLNRIQANYPDETDNLQFKPGYNTIHAGASNKIGADATDIDDVTQILAQRRSGENLAFSFIGGGIRNTIASSQSAILSGTDNNMTIDATNSLIGSGTDHINNYEMSAIAAGKQNQMGFYYSAPPPGWETYVAYNSITSAFNTDRAIADFREYKSAIGGGTLNTVGATESVIVGGKSNVIFADYSDTAMITCLDAPCVVEKPLSYVGQDSTDLEFCQGDCNADTDCPGTSLCVQRTNGEPASVEGCSVGDSVSHPDTDYCTQPDPGITTLPSADQGETRGRMFVMGGESNEVLETNSAIVSGLKNKINSHAAVSFIGAGTGNNVHHFESSILAGHKNKVTPGYEDQERTVRFNIFTDSLNKLAVCSDIATDTNICYGSTIVAGEQNVVNGRASFTLAGENNTVNAERSSIFAGASNIIMEDDSFIGGGDTNLIDEGAVSSAILSGVQNNVNLQPRSAIGAGQFNKIVAQDSYIGAGQQNLVLGTRAGIGGGIFNKNTGLQANTMAGKYNTCQGANAGMGGGEQNKASGSKSFVGAGENNIARTSAACIAGQNNDAYGTSSLILSGSDNEASGRHSGIGAGTRNTASGVASAVIAGEDNVVSAENSLIFSGNNNQVSGRWSVIMGGHASTANGQKSAVIGGVSHTANGNHAVTVAGVNNHAEHWQSAVLGGSENRVSSLDSVIVAGKLNSLSSANGASSETSCIFAGSQNLVAANSAGVVAGFNNTVGTFRKNGDTLGIFTLRNDKRQSVEFDQAPNFLNSVVLAGENNHVGLKGKQSVIFGGHKNLLDTSRSVIFAGTSNEIGVTPTVRKQSGDAAIAAGTHNSVDASNAGVVAGYQNTVEEENSVVMAGSTNLVSAKDSGIVAGAQNSIEEKADNSAIIAGYINMIKETGEQSVVVAGNGNHIEGKNAIVVGGTGNKAISDSSVVAGGMSNSVTGKVGVVGAGDSNDVSGDSSIIGSGMANSVTGINSVIFVGQESHVSGDKSVILGGKNNMASNLNTIVIGNDGEAKDQNSLVFATGNGSGLTKCVSSGEHTVTTCANDLLLEGESVPTLIATLETAVAQHNATHQDMATTLSKLTTLETNADSLTKSIRRFLFETTSE